MKFPNIGLNGSSNSGFLLVGLGVAAAIIAATTLKGKAPVDITGNAGISAYWTDQGSLGHADLENYINTVPTPTSNPIPPLYHRITIAEWNGPCL